MNTESFAIFTSCILIIGIGTVYWIQQFASVQQCSSFLWILLLPTILYYNRIMLHFNEHEKAFKCEPPASILSCVMSIGGCLLLEAVAIFHTRVAYYELYTVGMLTTSFYSVFRITTAVLAWTSFVAAIGHSESEKLAYLNQSDYQNKLKRVEPALEV